MLNWLSGAGETYINVYLGFLRYCAPVLAAVLLWRCLKPLVTFKREPEIWAWLDLADGSKHALTHWENVVGRSKSSDVRLDYPSVSRNHAVFTRYDDGSWTVTDADSKGGVLVNGTPVQICALEPEDVINIGGMDMMRGEEVEAIGLYKLVKPRGAAMFVLPGTHNKFVSMGENGEILGCMTSISGELLDAVTHHTIIAEAVGHSFVNADEYDSEYAKAGARECAVSGLGRAAFAGRILATLGGKDKAKLQSYLLGAVLALDVQAMQSFVGDQENVEAYIAGKAPLQQCFCDVMEALAAGEAHQVPAEISGRMGLEGVLEIAF